MPIIVCVFAFFGHGRHRRSYDDDFVILLLGLDVRRQKFIFVRASLSKINKRRAVKKIFRCLCCRRVTPDAVKKNVFFRMFGQETSTTKKKL